MRDIQKQRAWQAADLKRKREAWLRLNGPCRKCGSWDRLEVDHIEPSQKESHSVWSWSRERRDAELSKCQPLCHECHKAKTAEGNKKPITHGTPGGYDRGCRCAECFEWQKNRMDKYHKEHPRSKKKIAGVAQLVERDLAKVEAVRS